MHNKRGPLKMPYVPITKHGPFTVKGNRDPRKHTLFSSETYLTMHWLVQCPDVLVSCMCLQEEYYENLQSSESVVTWLEAHRGKSQVSWAVFPVGSPAICVAWCVLFNSSLVHLKMREGKDVYPMVRLLSSNLQREQKNVGSQRCHWSSKYSDETQSERSRARVQVSLYFDEYQSPN